MNFQYKTLALLTIGLHFLKSLVFAVYYLGINDFMKIEGFITTQEPKVNYLHISLQLIFVFFTVMSYIKREAMDFKKILITILFLILTVQYVFYFKNSFFYVKEDKSSVILEKYPKEIDDIIKEEIEFKEYRYKKISVGHSYKTSITNDVKTFEGVDSSEYNVNVMVFDIEDSTKIYDESYMMRIDTSFNLLYKHSLENFKPTKTKPKKWKFETLKKNLTFF